MSIAIIKYNGGNVFSVESAIKAIGAEVVITGDKDVIRKADKVIFPGVGEAASAMQFVREEGLADLITSLQQPVLGICLGMQLMCRYSEEGDADCLGIFDACVSRFTPRTNVDKIPHMGWNTITALKDPLFNSDMKDEYVYFVHSYYVPLNVHTIATTNYIQPFSAALNKANFYGTQFHPEKSSLVGQQILKNFLSIK